MALVCVCRGYFTSLFAFEEQGGRAADETDCRGRNRNYRHPLAATPSLYGCRPGDAALRALRMRQECVHCRQTGVVACAVHAHIFWLSDQKFRVSRPLAAARDSSSACLITLTARACIPLWRPNIRLNWNRKLEQMLFWQNSFRKPFFQFLTDFGKLPVFLFQCRSTSTPPTTSGSPLHVRPHGLRAGQEIGDLAPSKYSCKLEQETGTDAVLAKLLPRTYFSISHRL